jgi:hypothetical protein
MSYTQRDVVVCATNASALQAMSHA